MRKTNIEALRIVAMTFIVILHFCTHSYSATVSMEVLQPIILITSCGVNLFVLISGYFGMRLSVKSFLFLAIVVLSFSVLNMIFAKMIFGMSFTPVKIIKAVLLPFSGSVYWFIKSYVGLLVISPFLNMGLRHISLNSLLRIWCIYTAMIVLSCWYAQSIIDQGGYGIFQFIYLYFTGNLISKLDWTKKWYIYLGFAALFMTINIVINRVAFAITGSMENRYFNEMAYHYSNPLVLLASISLFLCFLKIEVKNNKYINGIASCALGCYLLQDGVCGWCIYGLQKDFSMTHESLEILLYSFGWILVFWLTSFCIFLLLKPFSFGIASFLDNKVSKKSFLKRL